MNQVNRILKLLIEIKEIVSNLGNSKNDEELREAKKRNASLQSELTKLKNKMNEEI